MTESNWKVMQTTWRSSMNWILMWTVQQRKKLYDTCCIWRQLNIKQVATVMVAIDHITDVQTFVIGHTFLVISNHTSLYFLDRHNIPQFMATLERASGTMKSIIGVSAIGLRNISDHSIINNLNVIWRVSAQGSVFRGWRWQYSRFMGQILQNTIFGVVNRHFQTKRVQYENSTLLKQIALLTTTISSTIKTKCSSWVAPTRVQRIQDGETTILKVMNHSYFCQVKISNFWKFNMADDCHLANVLCIGSTPRADTLTSDRVNNNSHSIPRHL